jgi:murein DD-endopeptidase MepM/ murein hydrolase activator NlpD
VTAAPRRLLLLLALFSALQGSPAPSVSAGGLSVRWEPAHPRAGDVVLMRVHGVPAGAVVDATIDGHPVSVFPSGPGHAGVVGIDMDAPPGPRRWQVTAKAAGAVLTTDGELPVVARSYQVQHLTVARTMVELDPATERRAVEEGERLRATYRLITGERLWRGAWVRPVAGDEPGTGFGARRVINGQPRAPHSGIDFAAPVGTPVLAANRGRVALVGEFFFPGRLVILDHGLGLYTLYFHLDTIAVTEGQLVARGETLGTVGMTGRVTGPHLHFGAQVGAARIDPAALLGLAPGDEG